MIKKTLAAIALAAALLAPVALAEPIPANGTTPAQIQRWLSTRGMVGQIKQGKDSPYISLKTTGGLTWEVDFYNCDSGSPPHCPSIQFTAWWTGTFTKDMANSWNRDYRYLKAYVDDDLKTITVQQDVMLVNGITTEQLNQDLDIWLERLPKFDDHVAKK